MNWKKILGAAGIKVRHRKPEEPLAHSAERTALPSTNDSDSIFELAKRDDVIGMLTKGLRDGLYYNEKGQSSVLVEIQNFLSDKPEYDIKSVKTNNGETIAHIAARYGMDDVLSFVVQKDKRLANSKNNQGLTPLHFAADISRELKDETQGPDTLQDHLNCMETLLKAKAGADPNAAGFNGETALHVLLGNKNRMIIPEALNQFGDKLPIDKSELDRFLYSGSNQMLQNGANVNATTADNTTPIYEAVSNFADIDLVRMLLYQKADPNIKSRRVEKPALSGQELHGLDALELGKVLDYPDQGKFEYLVSVKNSPPIEPTPEKSPDHGIHASRKGVKRNPNGTTQFPDR